MNPIQICGDAVGPILRRAGSLRWGEWQAVGGGGQGNIYARMWRMWREISTSAAGSIPDVDRTQRGAVNLLDQDMGLGVKNFDAIVTLQSTTASSRKARFTSEQLPSGGGDNGLTVDDAYAPASAYNTLAFIALKGVRTSFRNGRVATPIYAEAPEFFATPSANGQSTGVPTWWIGGPILSNMGMPAFVFAEHEDPWSGTTGISPIDFLASNFADARFGVSGIIQSRLGFAVGNGGTTQDGATSAGDAMGAQYAGGLVIVPSARSGAPSNGQMMVWNSGTSQWDPATPASGGAPTNATYVTLSTNGTLTDERVLTAGSGISITDGGAGGNVTIASTVSAAPTNAQYVTLALDATLTNERVLTAGTNITIVDGGANNPVTLSSPTGATGTTVEGDTITAGHVTAIGTGLTTQTVALAAPYVLTGAWANVTGMLITVGTTGMYKIHGKAHVHLLSGAGGITYVQFRFTQNGVPLPQSDTGADTAAPTADLNQSLPLYNPPTTFAASDAIRLQAYIFGVAPVVAQVEVLFNTLFTIERIGT